MIAREQEFLGIARTSRELVAVFKKKDSDALRIVGRGTLIYFYILQITTAGYIEDKFKPLLMLEATQQGVMSGEFPVRQFSTVSSRDPDSFAENRYATLIQDVRRHRISPLADKARPLHLMIRDMDIKENRDAASDNQDAVKTLLEMLKEAAKQQDDIKVTFYRSESDASFVPLRDFASKIVRTENSSGGKFMQTMRDRAGEFLDKFRL